MNFIIKIIGVYFFVGLLTNTNVVSAAESSAGEGMMQALQTEDWQALQTEDCNAENQALIDCQHGLAFIGTYEEQVNSMKECHSCPHDAALTTGLYDYVSTGIATKVPGGCSSSEVDTFCGFLQSCAIDKCHANCHTEFMAYADCGLKMHGCAYTCGNAPTHTPSNATDTPSNATDAPTYASKSPGFKAGIVTASMLGAVSLMWMFLV
jgi:hypothetical protein